MIILIHVSYSGLMLPPNPFMPSSCDKQLSFFTPLRLRDFTICQGDAFRPSPWHTVGGRGGWGSSQSHPEEEERKKEKRTKERERQREGVEENCQ